MLAKGGNKVIETNLGFLRFARALHVVLVTASAFLI